MLLCGHVSRCPVDGISCQVVGGSGQSVALVRLPENWPRAQPSRQLGSAPRQERSPFQPPPLRRPSRAPEVVVNDAIGEIKSLEGAIDLLGPASVHAKPLLTALKAAQERSKVGPIQERLDSCRQFIDRAKKRVLRADEVIARAVEQKAIFEAEVAQAEQRLVLLQAEAAATIPAVFPEAAEVKELQTQIDLLVRERDALKSAPGRQVGGGEGSATWMGSGPPCVENIPPMPTFDLQDLERWMCDRNCDLRNAMEFGDSSLISKIGGLGGARDWAARDFKSRCVDGRSFEIFSDVIVDRDGRCLKDVASSQGSTVPVARVSDDPSSTRVSWSQGWRSFTSRPAQEAQPIGGFCRCC